jgi:hypothetical protein
VVALVIVTFEGLLRAMRDSLENPPAAHPAHHSRGLLATMIVLTTGYAGLFAFSILAAIVSPMVFDSAHGPREWSAFFAFLFFPMLVLLSIGLSWYGYALYRYRLIPVGFALPILYGVVFWFSFS